MKLIVGLGNPGLDYSGSRHNAGFMVLNRFARQNGISFNRKEKESRTGKGEVEGQMVLLARPQTFMNLSGESVSRLMEKYKIGIEDLLVVHDDLDLPLGRIRIRRGSGSGGHRGVQSIIDCLGRKDFLRLRIGIGRPKSGSDIKASEEDIISFVLEGFTNSEKKVMDESLSRASDAILYLLKEGMTAAMNGYN